MTKYSELDSSVIREFQIKTTVRYFTTMRITHIKKKTRNNLYWWVCGKNKSLLIVDGSTLNKKNIWRFLSKVKIEHSYDLEILLLGIYPQEIKTFIQKDKCMSLFIARFIIISGLWDKSRCPTAG